MGEQAVSTPEPKFAAKSAQGRKLIYVRAPNLVSS